MKNSIKTELTEHLILFINEGILTNENKDDWHFKAFNEDYYIIGYYQATEWLKEHNLGEFEAAGICQQYEIDHFGNNNTIYDNSEKVVNMIAYIYGEELIQSLDVEDIYEMKKELIESVTNILN